MSPNSQRRARPVFLTNLAEPRLLIGDELGYLPLEPDAAHRFFQLVSRPCDKGAMLITANRTISACRGLLTAPLSAGGAKASWPLPGHRLRRRRGRNSDPRSPGSPRSLLRGVAAGVPAKPVSWGDCLLHHSDVVTIRGDSHRRRAKRRRGLLQKPTAPEPTDIVTA